MPSIQDSSRIPLEGEARMICCLWPHGHFQDGLDPLVRGHVEQFLSLCVGVHTLPAMG